MQKSNLMPAFGAGFGLIAREPLSVLAWGLVSALLYLGPVGLYLYVIGPELIGFYGGLFSDPAQMSQGLPPSLARAQAIQPLQLVLSLVGASIIYPAIFRAVLFPEERRWAYLRLGATEFHVGVIFVVLYVLLIVVMFVFALILMVPLGIAIGVSMASDSSGAAAVGGVLLFVIPLTLAISAAAIYVFGRLWMGAPMTVADNRLRLFDGWVFTRGYGWRLMGLAMLPVLIVVAFYVAMFGAAWAVLGNLAGDNDLGQIGDFLARQDWQRNLGRLIIGYLGFAAIFATFFTPIMIAPWARAYKLIVADKDHGSGEVFA